MAHMMKKKEFKELVSGGRNYKVRSVKNSVFLAIDGVDAVEVYRASTMEETGLISAMNQAVKYKKWIEA